MIKKISKLFHNNFFKRYLPVIPRFGARYKTLLADLNSAFQYYVLFNRKNPKILLESFSITPTTFCNANCVYCANRCLKDKREFLSFKLFKKAVDEYVKLGYKDLGLTPTIGEALIDTDFFNKVKYAKKRGLTLSLCTNALLLSNYIKDILFSGINDLQIDLADILPEYDSKVFQINLKKSEERIKAILSLLGEMEEGKVKMNLTLSFRSQRKPREVMASMEKSEFWKYYKKGLFKMFFLQVYDNWGGQITQEDLLGIQKLKIVPKMKKYLCRGLFTLSLLPNGDLRLCGCRFKETLKDELVIGNLKRDSIKKVMSPQKYKDILKNFYKGNLPKICIDCSLYRPRIVI